MAEDFSDRASWFSFFDRYRENTGHEPPEASPKIRRAPAEFKPCPLCGHSVSSSAFLYRSSFVSEDRWMASIECSCGISYDIEFTASDDEEARREFASRWNRRHR